MDALPNIYLTWDESTEPLAEFLRYQVYRRPVTDPVSPWVTLQLITDRSRTFYNDYLVGPSSEWQYAVTQVCVDDVGEEIESDFTPPAQAQMTLTSYWFHLLDRPEVYAQVKGSDATVQGHQEMELVQVRGRRHPTAHFGPVLTRTFHVAGRRPWSEERDVWQGLLDVQSGQTGSMVVFRSARDDVVYGVLRAPLPRGDGMPDSMSLSVDFIETHYEGSN